ncbi:MAG: helix-turn-helix domain-containing protein [Bacteroidales bacterium]|nr:helix-turn-helix domain-containing protein [Bacteroidales bacterium]
MKTSTPKSNGENIANELKALFKKQDSSAKLITKLTQKYFEEQKQINALLLKRINSKIVETVVEKSTLTEKEVRERLDVSKSTLQRLRNNKRLVGVKPGKSYIYTLNDVHIYIERLKAGDFD